jgi:hypothetical protein
MAFAWRRRPRNHDGQTRFWRVCFRFPSNIKPHTSTMSPWIPSVISPSSFRSFCLGNDAVLGGVGGILQARSRRLGRKSVSVFGGGMVDFLSLAQSADVNVFPFYLCPDFTTILYLASFLLFPPESSLNEFVITKLTITLTMAHSSFSLHYSRRSISSIPF